MAKAKYEGFLSVPLADADFASLMGSVADSPPNSAVNLLTAADWFGERGDRFPGWEYAMRYAASRDRRPFHNAAVPEPCWEWVRFPTSMNRNNLAARRHATLPWIVFDAGVYRPDGSARETASGVLSFDHPARAYAFLVGALRTVADAYDVSELASRAKTTTAFDVVACPACRVARDASRGSCPFCELVDRFEGRAGEK